MKAFDWQRMALDNVPLEFLGEVITMNAGGNQCCPCCANPEWSKASQAKWLT